MNIPSIPPPSWKPPGNSAVTVVSLASFWLWVIASEKAPAFPIAVIGSVLIVAMAALTRKW